MAIDKITRLSLREVWKHEALDFTTWLEQNIDALNDAIDITIVNVEREQSAGNFNVDLVGEDEQGNTIIIENQLEQSDHDHLGKLLTYLTSLEAKGAIWIVAKARQEHMNAITWLNETTDTPFYLIQVEAIQIGDSSSAALFTEIVGPSPEARIVGEKKKEINQRMYMRKAFWKVLLDHAKTKTKLHANVSPSIDNWVSAGAGISGLSWNYVTRKHGTQVELYISTGEQARNKKIFNTLYATQEEVEKKFRDAIEWQRLEGKQTCRICYRIEDGGWLDEHKWVEIAKQTVDKMISFEKALGPYVKNLKRV